MSHLLPLMSIHWHIVIARSPQCTLWFPLDVVHQQSPTFLAPGTGSMEDNFSGDQEGGGDRRQGSGGHASEALLRGAALYNRGSETPFYILCVWTDAQRYSITQSSFTALKILCVSCVRSSPTPNPANRWFFYSIHGFVFSRVSYSWNHKTWSLFSLASFT